MNDSLSLSLSLSLLQYLKKKNQKPLYQALQKIKEGHQYSPLSFSLYYMHIYIYTHTHIHIELDIFWVCLIISFYGVTECRVDVVGVHITATHSVPSTDCQNLHTRELSQ